MKPVNPLLLLGMLCTLSLTGAKAQSSHDEKGARLTVLKPEDYPRLYSTYTALANKAGLQEHYPLYHTPDATSLSLAEVKFVTFKDATTAPVIVVGDNFLKTYRKHHEAILAHEVGHLAEIETLQQQGVDLLEALTDRVFTEKQQSENLADSLAVAYIGADKMIAFLEYDQLVQKKVIGNDLARYAATHDRIEQDGPYLRIELPFKPVRYAGEDFLIPWEKILQQLTKGEQGVQFYSFGDVLNEVSQQFEQAASIHGSNTARIANARQYSGKQR